VCVIQTLVLVSCSNELPYYESEYYGDSSQIIVHEGLMAGGENNVFFADWFEDVSGAALCYVCYSYYAILAMVAMLCFLCVLLCLLCLLCSLYYDMICYDSICSACYSCYGRHILNSINNRCFLIS
jgi:hypothetical protein